MNLVADFVQASQRQNTKRSYAFAIAHFELEYKGLLPTSSEVVASYLAAQAGTLSNNTLRQRLAALSRWHTDHGFTDPTKDATIGQLLKGIRATYHVPEQQALHLEIDQLQLVDA